MARALDHLVLAARDLPRLKAQVEALGFTVGARNRHPWGTENHIVQFRSTFLELIGLGTGHVLPFSRAARGPDGSDRTVAFTIAFAEASSMPDIGFFTCEQHHPENFWNTAFQVHPNGAVDLTGFTIVAERPGEQAAFLRGFAGQPHVVADDDGLQVELSGGRITIVPPRGGKNSDRLPPEASARIATMDIGVQDLAAARASMVDGDGWVETSEASAVRFDRPTFGLTFVPHVQR